MARLTSTARDLLIASAARQCLLTFISPMSCTAKHSSTARLCACRKLPQIQHLPAERCLFLSAAPVLAAHESFFNMALGSSWETRSCSAGKTTIEPRSRGHRPSQTSKSYVMALNNERCRRTGLSTPRGRSVQPCADPDVRLTEMRMSQAARDFQVASMVAWATASGGDEELVNALCVQAIPDETRGGLFRGSLSLLMSRRGQP